MNPGAAWILSKAPGPGWPKREVPAAHAPDLQSAHQKHPADGRSARARAAQRIGRELQGITLHTVGYSELVRLGMFPGGR